MISLFESELVKIGKKLSNSVVLVPDVNMCGDFFKYYREKVFVFGLSEQSMVSAAGGFCVRNKMPIIFLPASSVEKVLGQIKNICFANLNVKFAVFGEGNLSYLKDINNLSVFSAKGENELPEILQKFFFEYGPSVLSF